MMVYNPDEIEKDFTDEEIKIKEPDFMITCNISESDRERIRKAATDNNTTIRQTVRELVEEGLNSYDLQNE